MISVVETWKIQMEKDLDSSVDMLKKTVPGIPIDEILGRDTSNETDAAIVHETDTTKVFELPIYCLQDYETSVHALDTTIATDLELIVTQDNSDEAMNMYQYLFNMLPKEPKEGEINPLYPKYERNVFAEELMPEFQHHYTTNTTFLQDTQVVVKNMEHVFPKQDCTVTSEKIKENWKTVKYDQEFYEKYGYLEWDMLKPFNTSSNFLQALSIAHILSPLMSFFIPFLFLIFPFVILQIQGVHITLSKYFVVLKSIAQNHFIGKALTSMENFSISNLMYFLGMLGLYMLQMYQNTVQCIRFYNNTQRINTELCEWKEFCAYSVKNMEKFLEINQNLETYKPFCIQVSHHRTQLISLQELLGSVCPFKCNLGKTGEIGYMLRCYYELHTNEIYEESVQFSMGFDGYIYLMNGLYRNLCAGAIGLASYVDIPPSPKAMAEAVADAPSNDLSQNIVQVEEKESIEEEDTTNTVKKYIKDQYYPAHMYQKSHVKNDVSLQNNLVITGPNASGKTTYLKTTAVNIIFSQQLGMGFYSECQLQPYHHMHSYLNIPDTSGRDSLFQAESRRCKEILSSIQDNGIHETHFCIFDELYSGTNPNEASKAAYAFMEYIRGFSHVDLLLTTHYTSICQKWKSDDDNQNENENHSGRDKCIENCQMEVLDVVSDVVSDVNTVQNTYRIIPGISTREGALRILEEMDYPHEMLSTVKNVSFETTHSVSECPSKNVITIEQEKDGKYPDSIDL